jgi:hypothetical protein
MAVAGDKGVAVSWNTRYNKGNLTTDGCIVIG